MPKAKKKIVGRKQVLVETTEPFRVMGQDDEVDATGVLIHWNMSRIFFSHAGTDGRQAPAFEIPLKNREFLRAFVEVLVQRMNELPDDAGDAE